MVITCASAGPSLYAAPETILNGLATVAFPTSLPPPQFSTRIELVTLVLTQAAPKLRVRGDTEITGSLKSESAAPAARQNPKTAAVANPLRVNPFTGAILMHRFVIGHIFLGRAKRKRFGRIG